VVVFDCNTNANGTGNYNLYFTRAPGANKGGALLNGGQPIAGAIALGELDYYTFTANTAEGVFMLIVKADSDQLFPQFLVYGPHGTLISGSSCGSSGVRQFTPIPTRRSSYLVVVFDCNTNANGTGNYNLYFTKAPGANKDGALLNGGQPNANSIAL